MCPVPLWLAPCGWIRGQPGANFFILAVECFVERKAGATLCILPLRLCVTSQSRYGSQILSVSAARLSIAWVWRAPPNVGEALVVKLKVG